MASIAKDRALAAKQRVEEGLEAVRTGLGPYVARHMESRYGERWRQYVSRARGSEEQDSPDVYSLLKTLLGNWNELFRYDEKLRKARSFISLAMDARNAAAHYSGALTAREALRYLDAMRELLAAIGAESQARAVGNLYEEQHRAGDNPVARKTAVASRSEPAGGQTVRGKYAALYDHLSARTDSRWCASFSEVEAVLGFSLPASARRYPAWWANQHGGGHSHARAWQEAGWKTVDVNIRAGTLAFERMGGAQDSSGLTGTDTP